MGWKEEYAESRNAAIAEANRDAMRRLANSGAPSSVVDERTFAFVPYIEEGAKSLHALLDRQKNEEEDLAVVASARERQTEGGVFTGDPRELERLVSVRKQQRNLKASELAEQVGDDYRAAKATMATVRASYEQLRLESESYSIDGDPAIRAQLRTADRLDENALIARFRDLPTLAKAYERADDRRDRVLRVLVEAHAADGWRVFALKPTAADAAAMLRLRSAIAAAKEARVPQAVRDAEAKLKRAMPASLDATIRLLRAGRLAVA